jgi:hypothetical protein
MEARDEKRLLKLQAQLQNVKLLIVDELGYVPLSQVGAELLFEVFSQRYERGSIIVTSNLPFEEWPSVFRSERLTGALLDRLTHHVHILEMNGESYRLRQSAGRRRAARAEQNSAATRSDPAAPSGEHDHDPAAVNQSSESCIKDSAAAAARSLRRHGGRASLAAAPTVAPGLKLRRPTGRLSRRR